MKKQFAILLKWGALLGVALSFIQLARKFSDSFDFYAFGPIIDLLNALLFIGALYMGIKEVKEECYDNVISFSKAFAKGLIVVVTAFIIVFTYLNFHYGVFFKDQLQVVNEKNITRFHEQLENDSIKVKELDSLLLVHKHLIKKQETQFITNTQMDSLNSHLISMRVDTVLNYYTHFVKSQPITSDQFKLGKFDAYAKTTIIDILGKYLVNYSKSDTTLTFISTIIINGSDDFKSVSLLEKRFENEKSKIPFHKNSFSASLYFSLTVLIFGVLFDIFVAMYLYKRKSIKKEEESNE